MINNVLAGRGSVSWFGLSDDAVRIADNTINELMRRPDGVYARYVPPEQRPAIVRAGQIDGLRHIWRIEVETGVRPRAYGTQVTVENAVRLVTVVVDLAAKYLEIRAGNTLKKPTMQFLTNTMGIPLIEATNFRNFEGELDGLATVLGATVTGAHSTIALDQELDDGVYDRLGRVIEALDNAIAIDDPGLGNLEFAISEYKRDPSHQPIMLVLLNGLGALGMEISRLKDSGDLRVQLLYRLLKPLAEHAHGYLKLLFGHQTHTIRIGFTTNTLEFRTDANEELIKFVRERVATAS